MLDKTNNNLSCDLGEQIVSFVYGEIDEREKLNFQTHLEKCSTCAEEVSGFGIVRSSIQEWRVEDFAKISPPVFEVTPLKNEKFNSWSWFESIRAFFTLSTVRFSAGFASILVLAGLFWFFLGSANNSEIANNTLETNKTVSLPAIVETTPDDLDNVASVNTVDTVNPPEPERQLQRNQAKEIKVSVRSAAPKNQSSRNLRNSGAVSNNKINNKPAPITMKKNNPAIISYEEFEDKSLRLSDILEEVSMK